MSIQLDTILTYDIEIDFISENEIVLNFDSGLSVYQNGTKKVSGVKAIDFFDGTNTTAQVDLHNGRARVYINSTASGGAGGVTSVDGQTGVVVLSGTYQPLDSDLTAIAALSTTDFGRALLTLANIAAADWVAKTQTINGQAYGSGNIVLPLNDSTYYTQSGKYITAAVNGYSVSTNALAANTLRAYPIVISKSLTVTEILSNVSTQIAATVYRIGIYTDNGSVYPNALVSGSDAAEYDSSTQGNKSSGAVSITLTPGLYWIAINSNGAPTLRSIPVAAIPCIIPHDGAGISTDGFTRYAVSQTYGAMPSSFPAGATTSVSMANRVELKV